MKLMIASDIHGSAYYCEKLLKAYDEEMRNYYQHRSSNAKDTAWSDELERILLRERRPFVLGFLQKKGFAEK